MPLFFNWIDKLKRYAKLEQKELNALIICIIVVSFALSFRHWGLGNQVDIGYGLLNFLFALVVVVISFFARIFFQKIVALGADYRAEFKMWSIGLLLCLLAAFVTNGWVLFMIPSTIKVHMMPGNRIGWVRYGLNVFGMGVVSLAGPIANIIMALIFRGLFDFTGLLIFKLAFNLNLWWACFSMIPIPPADGFRMIYGSRLVYMFGLAVIVSTTILLKANFNIFLTILLALAIGAIWWLIYYILWERHLWRGPYG